MIHLILVLNSYSLLNQICCFAAHTKKTRIIDVVYNASNNELVRTKTLVKNCIVQIDAAPFRQWFEAHYAVPIVKKSAKQVKRFIETISFNRVHAIINYSCG